MVILKRLSIRAATLLSCALIVIAALGSAGFGLYAIGSVQSRLAYSTNNIVPSLSGLANIRYSVMYSRLLLAKHLLAQNAAEQAAHTHELSNQIRITDERLQAYRELASDPARQKMYHDVSADWAKWKTIAASIVALPPAERATVGVRMFNGPLSAAGKDLADVLQVALDYNRKLANDGAAASALVGERITLGLQILAALTCLTLVLAIVVLRNRLSAPLTRLVDAMNEMAGGDLDRAVPGTSLTDEAGAIARALNGIKAGVAANIRADAERQAMTQARVVEALADALGRFKAGRLDCRIEQAFPDDYESLRIDFNEMVETLAGIIADVATVAASVKNGSAEIASAANDLSLRTASQAGAIEETAASVRQLNAGVGEAAQTAEQVSRDAGEAEGVASQSSAVMTEAVGAMEEIARSSSQMEAIVELIDGIAFQTNLLALNAGVEAARAGEAGKGFAVVASEVRSLAQRASEAARDITGIIKSSGSNVSRGVSLITRTQDGLGQIHARIASVARMIDALARNAREQAGTIAQIDVAIGEMDSMTQQNAALVEESTAASRSLANEADRLEHLMARFSGGGLSSRSGGASFAPAPASGSVPEMPRRAIAPMPRAVAATHGNAALAEDWSEF